MNNDLFPTEDQSYDDKSRWLDLFNARDEKVFKGWYETYNQPLTFFARKFLRHPEDIKDVLQDSYVKVWTNPTQFVTVAHLNNFLYKTVRNGCLLFLRDHGIESKALKEYGELTEMIESDPGLEKMHTELIREVHQKMSQLPSATREVLLLSILEDKTHAEVAAHLEISQTNAGVTKHRGLALLREWLSLSKKDKKGPALSLLLLLTSLFR